MRFVFLLLCSRAAAWRGDWDRHGGTLPEGRNHTAGDRDRARAQRGRQSGERAGKPPGFNSQDERVYGDESQNLLGKAPQKQFMLSKLLLGKRVSSAEVQSFVDQLYPCEFVDAMPTPAPPS